MIAAFLVYQFFVTIAFLLGLPFLIARFLIHPGEMKERFGLTTIHRTWQALRTGADEMPRAKPADRSTVSTPGDVTQRVERPIWLHAASLGELEALHAFLDTVAPELKEECVVSVTSVSARRQAASRLGDIPVSYAPLDLWAALGPFFSRVDPRGLVLFETELWPGLLAYCAWSKTPVLLLSARISDRNRLRHPVLRWLLRPFAGSIGAAGAQRDVDALRLRNLGVRNVQVTGNLKYRRTTLRPPTPDPKRPFLWTAGSVRKGEESIFESVLAVPGRSVIAPRHLREMEAWERTARAKGVDIVRRSTLSGTPEAIAQRWPSNVRCVLLDIHGELREWYRLSAACFVGGTLAPIGGHSLFEPAGLGCPVAFGPHHSGVADAADLLLAHGGGACVANAAALTEWLAGLEANADRRANAREGALRAAEDLASGSAETRNYLEREPACRWLALQSITSVEMTT